MSSLFNRLARRALTQAAGSAAAGKLAGEISQQASELAGRTAPAREDRTHFLLWLRGDFRKRQPQAFERIWTEIQRRGQWQHSDGQFNESDLQDTLSVLTAVWLQLRTDSAVCDEWFCDLGSADAEDFATLIKAARPQPSELQQNVESLLHAAAEKARDFDPTSERGQRQAAARAQQLRSLSSQLLGRRSKQG